jgi:hypothetical protein
MQGAESLREEAHTAQGKSIGIGVFYNQPTQYKRDFGSDRFGSGYNGMET